MYIYIYTHDLEYARIVIAAGTYQHMEELDRTNKTLNTEMDGRIQDIQAYMVHVV